MGDFVAETGVNHPLHNVKSEHLVERVRSGQIHRISLDGGEHYKAGKGGCDGKRDTTGDGRGDAGRGENGASSPSERALTLPWPRLRHGDTSTTRRGPLAAARGPDAGLSGLPTGADGGPVWPIREAAGRCGGGVHENGTWGRSGHPGPLSYANMLISGCAGQLE